MKRFTALLVVAAALAAFAAFSSGAFANSSSKHAATQAAQHLTIYVFRGKEDVGGASDGLGHDTMVPSTFAVKVGVPVKVTVINYDEGSHTITAPSLKLNKAVKPGTALSTVPANAGATEKLNQVKPSVTHFTFTVKKAGVYRWHCDLPCDAGASGWAMGSGKNGPGETGFMAGYIVGVS